MKFTVILLFAALVLWAQLSEVDQAPLSVVREENSVVLTDSLQEVVNISDSAKVLVKDSIVMPKKIFYAGLNSNDLPLFRDDFEQQIYDMWGVETAVSFVSPTSVARVRERLFGESSFVMDSLCLATLRKNDFGDAIVVIPSVVEYSIKPKRVGIVARIEGKLTLRYLFYDVASSSELMVVNVDAVSTIKKGLVLWYPLEHTTDISVEDLREIHRDLTKQVVREGYNVFRYTIL